MMKSQEIYGFVGWIGSFVFLAFYIFWALLPQNLLNSLFNNQLPNKNWTLAIPSIIVITLIFLILYGQAINMISTKTIDDVYMFQDNFSKFDHKNVQQVAIKNAIPDVYDIPLNVVNNILYQKNK